ncbi:hypothetical protein [Bacillus sp. X1(2014)]|uniref:hypothetical protein n=1 Tax=Bacillus sp. X1(2014) TaxID=1565991 RepID=UPI0021B241B3|nr:hypothetical protein [Bacillus sp. X1(2014)]
MDVKYIPSEWEKMKDGIGDLIGLGRWGKGMIDTLKDLSDNLEDAESDIANHDSDGVITFQHTSQKNKYQGLFEDFEVLHSFTGKVGDIVDRTIDQPFYEDMDAFVEAMRDLTISSYKTTNRIGATETQYVYAGYGYGYGPAQSLEVPKTEVSLDDLFSGDNYYAEQMKLEYDAWKELNPDQDFTQEEYQQGVLNTRAFEYESIRNQQEDKEFWVQIGALAVIVGATIICPPAGLALGAAYGALELSTAVSGKDWVSGRELGTGERWFRGLLAPLDIVPGVSGLTKFSSTVRLAHLGENIGTIGLRTGVKESIQQGMNHIDNMVKTAGQQSVTRLKSASSAIIDTTNVVKNKLAKDTLEAGRLVDSAITKAKNITPSRRMGLSVEDLGNTGKVRVPVENTHAVENKLKDVLSRIDGVNLKNGSSKVVIDSKAILGKYKDVIGSHPQKNSIFEVADYIIKKGDSIERKDLLSERTINALIDKASSVDYTPEDIDALKKEILEQIIRDHSDDFSAKDFARLWQGDYPYIGVDTYENFIVEKGQIIYAGYPFPTGYGFNESVLSDVGYDATKLFDGVQVKPRELMDGTGDYKFQAIGFQFNDTIESAKGITDANPQFGHGGLEQIFTPDFETLVRIGKVTPVLDDATRDLLRSQGVEFDPIKLQMKDEDGNYVYKSICNTHISIAEDSNVIKLSNYIVSDDKMELIKSRLEGTR